MSKDEADAFKRRQLLSHLRRSLSPYVYFSDLDLASSTANLGIEIQESIIDHSEKGRSVIRYYNIDNVATVGWKQKRGKITITGLSGSEFGRRARNKFMSVTERSQRVLLPSLYKQIVRIPDVDMNMRPLKRILVGVSRHGSYSPSDFKKGAHEQTKVSNYFHLLSSMDFIRPEAGTFVPGSEMKHLQADAIPATQLNEFILGEVLRTRQEYIRQVLHWTLIVPYLRWCTSYYLPAYKAGYLMQADLEELAGYYARYYGRVYDRSSEEPQLESLVNVRVLSLKQNRYYEGKQAILNDFAQNVKQDPVLFEALRS